MRIMIVDDSITSRTMLARVFERTPDLDVVAKVSSAEMAFRYLQSSWVDVILLDVEMPGLSGLEALPRMIELAQGARLMMVSALTVEGAEQTLQALALGAADTLAKPQPGEFGADYATQLIGKVRALGSRPQAEAIAGGAVRNTPPRILRARTGAKAQVLAIGASTGGIHALGKLLAGLPRRTGVPILVTQHLPAAFMPVLAKQLRLASSCAAIVAEDDMPVVSDRILIAPGDAHLTVVRQGGKVYVRLTRETVSNGCLPSVDPMFGSLADVYGAGAFGVVLSGMGRDGAAGAARMVEAGGTILAQDEASCAVWGMPRAVVEAGLASAILPPRELAGRFVGSLGAEAAL